MLDKYNHYSVNDFLDDAAFIRYVKYGAQEEVDRWNNWLAGMPPNEAAFREAYACLLAMLSAVRIQPGPAFGRQAWAVIAQQVEQMEAQGQKRYRLRFAAMAAAACMVLILAGYWYYNDKITITTGYAEQEQVTLPDNSQVTLNASSTLSYYRAWKWRGRREAWLSGEGQFAVTHPNKDTAHVLPGERFTLHAGNLLVQVLGTTFTVKQRRNSVTVALISGKISIADLHQPGRLFILQPGEVLTSSDTATRLTRIQKLTNAPQAWINHKIIANGMTVQDIIDNYEDTYGYRIILGNPAQATKRIDGTISLETADDVLYMLANILNANVERNGKQIYLHPK